MGTRNQMVDLGVLFGALRAKLAGDGLALPEYIFASDSEEQGIPPPNDSYLTLIFGAQMLDQAVFAGGGRTVNEFAGTLVVIAWTRLTVDQEYRDDAQVTDKILGGFELERRTIKSLNGYDLLDVSGNPLLSEPMRIISFHLKPRSIQPGWNGVGSAWELKYQLDITSPGWPLQ